MSRRVVAIMLVLVVAALVGFAAGCGGDQPKDPLAAALATANEVRDKLVDGGDWTALASQYSNDTYTKDSGGELGPVARGDMVQEFEDAVFSLAVGEISQPIKTDYGYHVIEVTAITEARQQTLDEVKESIKATLLDQAKLETWTQWVEGMKAQVGVVIYRDDLATTTTTIAAQPGSTATTAPADATTSTQDETLTTTAQAAVPADAVAKVGQDYITQAAFDDRVAEFATQYGLTEENDPDNYQALRSDVLDFMIQAALAASRAQELGLVVTDSEVQSEIDSVVTTNYGGDQAALEQDLASAGLNMAQFKLEYRDALVTQKVYEQVTGSATTVPDAEIAASYESNKDAYYIAESRTVRHILIIPSAEDPSATTVAPAGPDTTAAPAESTTTTVGQTITTAAPGTTTTTIKP